MVQRVEESLSSLQHCEELLKEEREREGVDEWRGKELVGGDEGKECQRSEQ